MNLVVRLMRIIEVKEDKKQYLDLLLLADEQENMIDRYLDKGKMYVRFPIIHSEARAWKAGRAANFAFTPCTHAARREIEGAILEAYKMKTGNVAGFEQRSVQ